MWRYVHLDEVGRAADEGRHPAGELIQDDESA